jgi:hypothetical protein
MQVRVEPYQGHVRVADLFPAAEVFSRGDLESLVADGIGAKDDAASSGEDTVGEIDVLVPERAARGEPVIESPEAMEEVTPDGEMPSEDVVRTQPISGPGASFHQLLAPPTDVVGQDVARRARVEKHGADHDVRPRSMCIEMCSHEPWIRLHVIVEEQEDVAPSRLGSPVPGRRLPPIGLLEGMKRKGPLPIADRLRGPIRGPVHHHDDFQWIGRVLPTERVEGVQHESTALVRGDHHRERWLIDLLGHGESPTLGELAHPWRYCTAEPEIQAIPREAQAR